MGWTALGAVIPDGRCAAQQSNGCTGMLQSSAAPEACHAGCKTIALVSESKGKASEDLAERTHQGPTSAGGRAFPTWARASCRSVARLVQCPPSNASTATQHTCSRLGYTVIAGLFIRLESPDSVAERRLQEVAIVGRAS
eukprot:6213381-Pleurochrysis_carterae.AAC.2